MARWEPGQMSIWPGSFAKEGLQQALACVVLQESFYLLRIGD
jgi:hypothetical protein